MKLKELGKGLPWLVVGVPAATQEAMPDKDFSIRINNGSAKPGEQVTITVDLKNNPGFCGDGRCEFRQAIDSGYCRQ